MVAASLVFPLLPSRARVDDSSPEINVIMSVIVAVLANRSCPGERRTRDPERDVPELPRVCQ